MKTQAHILFAHGSRNPDWKKPFEQMKHKAQTLTNARVELAFLELMSPSLDEVLLDLSHQGVNCIKITPIFLGLGNHVAHDLTEIVQRFAAAHPEVKVLVDLPVGESERVIDSMVAHVLAD